MRTIRELEEHELDELMRITVEAFPGMPVGGPDDRARAMERLRRVRRDGFGHFYGVFDDDRMVGVMRAYDFTMKLHETQTLLGGLGGVAVDLRHKKEHVAADMVRHFHATYRDKGAALTALYPFRPDFYRRMGYGYGVKLNRYSFRPDALPPRPAGARVEFLTADDKEAIRACYDRFMARTNGLFALLPHVVDNMFTDPAMRLVGYRDGGELRGYLFFRFEPTGQENWLANNIALRSLIYDDPATLRALLGFLRSQADQVDRVIYETQDDTFHYLLTDPRDGSGKLLAGLWHETNTQGAGIMYRVINVPLLFEVMGDHDFGDEATTVTVGLTLTDTFVPENAGRYRLRVEGGRATIIEDGPADVEIGTDIAEFSSLVVGAIPFDRLYAYGLATVSDTACVPLITRIFRAEHPPWCLTHF